MKASETKILKNGREVPTPVVVASLNTIIQMLAENPLVLTSLQPIVSLRLRERLSEYHFWYLWFIGVVGDDCCLKKDFRDVFQCAVSEEGDSLIITDPVN